MAAMASLSAVGQITPARSAALNTFNGAREFSSLSASPIGLPGSGLARRSHREAAKAGSAPGKLLIARASIEDSQEKSTTRRSEEDLGKRNPATFLLATLAAGMLLAAPAGDALAAQSSGRVGGSSFRSAPRQTVRTESRTNVYVNPGPTIVAPPVYSPPFFGGWGFGGWGYSPFYSPAPVVAVGVDGGSFFSFFLFASVGAVLFTVVSSLFRRND